MKAGDEIKKLIGKLAETMKKNKRVELMVYGALIALGVLLFASTMKPNNNPKITEQQPTSDEVARSERDMEDRLENVLSSIRGAGNVEVMIMYDTGTQIVPAMSVDTQTSTSQTVNNDTQTVNENQVQSQKPLTTTQGGAGQAVILTQKQPAIRGVIVIAQGAADVTVRVSLKRAVQTVMGVEPECVEVFEMKAADKE
ncbi:MAG: hypothetical protein RR232_01930 [Clostridia bacterium]